MSAPSNEVLLERLKSLEKQVATINFNFKDYRDSFVNRKEYTQYKETIKAELDPLKRLVWGATLASLGGFISAIYALLTQG